MTRDSAGSLLTIQLLVERRMNRDIDARWVDWAVGMLGDGHDTPTLRVLAGMSAPFNVFEMRELVDRTFSELGLRTFETLEEALLAYAWVAARQCLADELSASDALKRISDVHLELESGAGLEDLHMIHYAYDDLRRYDETSYWPAANRRNIEAIVRGALGEWATAARTPRLR